MSNALIPEIVDDPETFKALVEEHQRLMNSLVAHMRYAIGEPIYEATRIFHDLVKPTTRQLPDGSYEHEFTFNRDAE